MRNLDKKAETDPVIYIALKVYFCSLIVPEKKRLLTDTVLRCIELTMKLKVDLGCLFVVLS